MRVLGFLFVLSTALDAGPIEFGIAEIQAALAARGMKPTQLRVRYDLGPGVPGSWRIEGTRVTGGDLQGLMYGLLEAAGQIRARGRLSIASGSAALAMRGVRLELAEPEKTPEEQWRRFLEFLARSRINRLQLRVPHSEPPVEFLRQLSKLCAEFVIDLVIGLSGSPSDGFALYSRLKTIAADLPLVRSVHLRFAAAPEETFYRQWIFRAAEEAGRRIIVEFDHRPPLNGLPVRVSQPYVDAATVLSTAAAGTYFQVPSPLSQGAPVWSDPAWTRHIAGTLERTPALGFEIDAPWPWEPQRLFYLAWGRAGYNPRISDADLSLEAERLYGKAGASLYRAWTSASHAFSLALLFRPGSWLATAEEISSLQHSLSHQIRTAAEQAASIVHQTGGDPVLLRLIDSARRHAAQTTIPADTYPKPRFLHYPPKSAPAGIRFPLGLIVQPVRRDQRVRLHYRSRNDASFHTMSTSAKSAWFQVEAGADLIYYFEILTGENHRWFHPDPLAGSPYLYLPVRPRIQPDSDGPDA